MDFNLESRILAVNEACVDPNNGCAINKLCQECEALATLIERKLHKAYIEGVQDAEEALGRSK